MIYDKTVKISGKTYDVIASAGEYDYSWAEAALLRRDGQLYYGYTSGCSCDSFEDNLDEGDLQPVRNWQQAVEKAKKDLAPEHAVTFAERLVELRPAPSLGEPGGELPRAIKIAMGGVNL